MSPTSSSALRQAVALAAGLAVLAAAGCRAPDERDRGAYDPREPVVSCLRGDGVPAALDGGMAVLAGDVRIEFLATPGTAEARQIEGRAQGAEQIGRALLWVRDASDAMLDAVEECVDK